MSEDDDDFLLIIAVDDATADWRPTEAEKAEAIARATAEGKTSAVIGPGATLTGAFG
jgi:hypothetical protein